MELFNFITDMNAIQATVLAVGLILVVIEMFYPGFGAPGITGGILLVIGIFMTAKTLLQAFILVVIILAVLGLALIAVLHSATKGRLSRTMILSHSQQKESGYIGMEDLEFFLGKEGNTLTVLRPSGSADFDGVKLDVVSEGEFISPGKKVKVVKVQGRRIVVREMIDGK